MKLLLIAILFATATESQVIQAENWATMSGVQSEPTTDSGGGKNVGFIDQGDWMEYSITIPQADVYTVNFRIATFANGARLQFKSGNNILADVTFPATGGFQTYQTFPIYITLPAGTQTLRIQSVAAPNFNINWFELISGEQTYNIAMANYFSKLNDTTRCSVVIYYDATGLKSKAVTYIRRVKRPDGMYDWFDNTGLKIDAIKYKSPEGYWIGL